MKAKVFYKNEKKNMTTKTIDVPENEPCSIVRQFLAATGKPRCTYITHIRCGRFDYQWKDTAHSAY